MGKRKIEELRITDDELKQLRKKFKAGGRVMAGTVEHIRQGETGIVGEVKDNGNILVFWTNGIVSDVHFFTEEIFPIEEKGCILGRKMDFKSGSCGAGMHCETCGWNYDVAEKRKMMIRRGQMEKGEDGVSKLMVSKY